MAKKSAQVKKLPLRSKVKTANTWDLSSLYKSDTSWARDLNKLKKQIPHYEEFRGQLGSSAAKLAECLKFDSKFDRLADRLGTYAFLRTTEDQANDAAQRMYAQFINAASRASEVQSFIRPEILALSAAKLKRYLSAKELAPFRLSLERLLRFKKHTLSSKEEQLLAMQTEMAGAANKAFRQLLDADLKFGMIKDGEGRQIELTNSTFLQLLQSSNRQVRKNAFQQYYAQFVGHENTLAATLSSSIHKDVYYARAKQYDSALAKSIFPDNVPQTVYDRLISTVHENLPALYDYYELRRRKMKLRQIHHYDTYTPILNNFETKRTWNQAVKLIIAALQPLGADYCRVLEKGLTQRWCDRYPNQGKQSGAFSCGSYDGDPYILMNYQPNVLRDVFTLAHEAGHSMHSYYSSKHQSFEYHNYTIFVAEVASTFNESLLIDHMLKNAKTDQERAYLINHEIDDIRATIYRQTMFAEFEKITHEMAESGEPLTLQSLKDAYRKLLDLYFGPKFVIDDVLSLECLRIPHFYRAFYVFKYATGMSAAIALSQRVLNGGKKELNDYLGFLKGGCSQDPLDLLRGAGVDMVSPAPVTTALQHFANRVSELESLL